ncbi:integrase core domain-containing protein [Mesorhizobium sp.]|uniref:integrase core domain-containing protein n=1 Tax=Mesorhizobium sp. TaxID=1871066 RepID=UPI0025DEFF34|nr:integrase core domain-containing protein [Mesorhizobium sp.]
MGIAPFLRSALPIAQPVGAEGKQAEPASVGEAAASRIGAARTVAQAGLPYRTLCRPRKIGRSRSSARCRSAERRLDHARSAIAEWREDFNTARPHSSLGYRTPAAYAKVITATGSDAVLTEGSAPPPVAQLAPRGVTETAKALIATG